MRSGTYKLIFTVRMLCVLIFLAFMLASFSIASTDAGLRGLTVIGLGALVASGYAMFAIGWRPGASLRARDALNLMLLLPPFALALLALGLTGGENIWAGILAGLTASFTALLMVLCGWPSLLHTEPD